MMYGLVSRLLGNVILVKFTPQMCGGRSEGAGGARIPRKWCPKSFYVIVPFRSLQEDGFLANDFSGLRKQRHAISESVGARPGKTSNCS